MTSRNQQQAGRNQQHAGPVDAAGRLIVALDLPSVGEARALVAKLAGAVSFYKVGLQLQMAPGVEGFIRELIDGGNQVFLDYKYFDIGETVEKAVRRAAEFGVTFLTVHGQAEIMRAAARGKAGSALKVLCVTLLTSLDAADVKELFGTEIAVKDFVLARARKSFESGCDGVIASPAEAAAIRAAIRGGDFLIVTPGVRRASDSTQDHKRSGTPAAALGDGADYLVVGRPIVQSADPAAEARAFVKEMQAALDARG